MIERETGKKEILEGIRAELALKLLDTEVIRFGYFNIKLHDKFPQAPLLPLYIDSRRIPRFPNLQRMTVDIYEKLLEPLDFDLIAPVPTGAIPFTTLLSDRLGYGMVTPRKDKKLHGTTDEVGGMLDKDKGKCVVVIDDVVSQADSKLETAEVLKRNGFVVEDIVVLIDHELGGEEELIRRGFKLHSVMKTNQMFDYYDQIGKLDHELVEHVRRGMQGLREYLSINKLIK
ncbi:MAG: hypothetical protein HYT11_00740 [Candidatus Levybacteria bacterium]|nr:hypothetical protein [Candidatus Levybacteria bacterium]